MPDRFEWEEISEYEPISGIEAVDKALAYANAVPLLKEHLAQVEAQEGREAVIATLTTLADATPAGSPAHEGSLDWLGRYRAGAKLDDL